MTDDTLVTRSGLIFKAGDYRPKRDFAMTPTEVLDAARAFQGPQAVELEHFQTQGHKTFLDGKMGRLVAVWPSADGSELFGQVEVPQWLDNMWGDAGRKVSAVWETVGGAWRLIRLGLCLNPAIPDAQLFAASDTAAFAARVGGSMRRHFDQTHAAAEVARQQWQRQQAAQKGQTMKLPSIFPLTPSTTVKDAQPAHGGALDAARRRALLSASGVGQAILRDEEALLSATHYGRQALAARERQTPAPAMFAESPDASARLRSLLAMTHYGQQALAAHEQDQRLHGAGPALFANPALREVTVRDLERVDRLAPYVTTPADAEDIARMIASGGHPWWVVQSMQTVLRAVCQQKGIAVPSLSSAA